MNVLSISILNRSLELVHPREDALPLTLPVLAPLPDVFDFLAFVLRQFHVRLPTQQLDSHSEDTLR